MEFNVEEEPKDTKKKNVITWVIIITISLVVGLTVYFITDKIINSSKSSQQQTVPVKEKELNVNDNTIQILYRYVTFGTRKKRNDKFIKENETNINSFTAAEKLYYALQFARRDDFTDTGKTNAKGEKIYNINSQKLKEFLERYFGPSVSVPDNATLPYTFQFSIGGKNSGTLTKAETDGYNVVFEKREENIVPDLVEPFYGELIKAYQETNGTYRLEEKVIYTRVEKNSNYYTVYIYGDYNQTKLLETLTNQTETSLKADPIKVDRYVDKAATISYHFNLDNNKLYYDSSKIMN